MITIGLIILFILQIGSFYFISLLYMKITKQEKVEHHQQQLMRELEDNLALYIEEVKEENERLIEKITALQSDNSILKDDANVPTDGKTSHPELPLDSNVKVTLPKAPTIKALDSYRVHQSALDEEKTDTPVKMKESPKKETEFEQVYRLSNEGLSVDEIASRLEKGKTEVELILKFKR